MARDLGAKLVVVASLFGYQDYASYLFTTHAARLEQERDASLFRVFVKNLSGYSSLFERARTVATVVLDRVLYVALRLRRWNGLARDIDRQYPIR